MAPPGKAAEAREDINEKQVHGLRASRGYDALGLGKAADPNPPRRMVETTDTTDRKVDSGHSVSTDELGKTGPKSLRETTEGGTSVISLADTSRTKNRTVYSRLTAQAREPAAEGAREPSTEHQRSRRRPRTPAAAGSHQPPRFPTTTCIRWRALERATTTTTTIRWWAEPPSTTTSPH